MDPDLDPAEAPGPASPAALRDLSPEERERLPGRDPEVLERFYEAYIDRVYGYVRRLLKEDHLAEDVTQDVFMHIHRSLPRYDPRRALRPWVFTIATNKVRDHWRARRPQEDLDAEDGEARIASNHPGPAEHLEAEELGRLVAEAIEGLPESMRTTLLLRTYEGLSFEEIGAILERNEPAVRKRYSRALEELRSSLGRVLGPESPSA